MTAMLYVDIPSVADLKSLAAHRDDICVSIYLPTTPVSQEAAGDRIELKNLAKEALRQLETANADKRRVAALMEHFDDLVDDDEFWRFQARSLAVLATPDNARTFRVPNALVTIVEVSDRFHLKPLLRAIAFPNTCFVLALAENAVRVIQVSADLPPLIVKVEGMPKDAGSAVGRASVNDRSPSGRIQGSEGQKVLLRQFARKIDHALRGLLTGSDIQLVLAASEPLASIYRSVNTYTHLAKAGIDGSPVRSTDAQLADRARALLDGLYRDEIAQWKMAFAARENEDRATTDIARAARAATYGAVETMLVDIDEVVPGTVDETDGTIAFAKTANARDYGVVDEIASRVIRSGGRILGVRKADIPGGKSLAAILRYAM
jgi:Bacterial archaeo-eukaryotic release factor family 11